MRWELTQEVLSYQSVPQDQKSVTFLHSVISLNQLLQNSKNTAYIFLTFRNHVKIFLSQNILQNILNVVYRPTLSIRTERTDKQWRHWSDCSLRSSLIRVFTVCHSICFICTMILQGKPKLFSFRIFSILFSGVPILRSFHLKKCLLIAFECRKWLLWAVTVRIMFLLDQAGDLKIRWNLVLCARLICELYSSVHRYPGSIHTQKEIISQTGNT